MDAPGIEEQLRELCERNSPPFDEGSFSDRLRRKTNRSPEQPSAPRQRRGLRIAGYVSLAAALTAAITVGALEAVEHLGEDESILVISDDTLSPSTAAGQTTQTSGLFPVLVDGKWGFIDNTGTIRIEPRFEMENCSGFSEGLAAVSVTENGVKKWGYIDTSGAWVVEPRFGYAEDFSDGMAVAAEQGETEPFGYIDTSGTLVIPTQYQGALPFREGLGLVYEGHQPFFIDKTGATVLGPYDFAYDFSEGLAYVEEGERRGFIDKNGDWVAELESAWSDFSSYLSSFFPFPSSSQGFSEGLMALQSNPKRPMGTPDKGYVDKTGAWVIEPRFNHACGFSEGLAAVGVMESGGLEWGYIDKTGAWVIQPQFDYTSHFSEGLAAVWTNGNGSPKFGYIDKTGTVVIPMQYARAQDFSGGIAEVVSQSDAYSSGSPTYIDKTGKVIWQAR